MEDWGARELRVENDNFDYRDILLLAAVGNVMQRAEKRVYIIGCTERGPFVRFELARSV